MMAEPRGGGGGDRQRARGPVYLAVCLFGVNATLATNAIWVEMPALMAAAPEGRSLMLYLMVLLEVGHLASLAYLLIRKCSAKPLSEVPIIYCSFVLGMTSLLTLGFFWNFTTDIVGQAYSFPLLICAFISALVSCISMVSYVPFSYNLREPYITATMFGEGLGVLLPHLLGLAQGLGREPECEAELPYNYFYNATKTHSYSYFPRTTTTKPILEQRLLFSESWYFFVVCCVVGVSAASFAVLRCSACCQREYVPDDGSGGPLLLAPARGDDVSGAGADVEMSVGHEEDAWGRDRLVLDDGSIRHGTHMTAAVTDSPGHYSQRGGWRTPATAEPHRPRVQLPSSSSSIKSAVTSNTAAAEEGRPRSFLLLLAVTLWTSSILHGPLSSIKAYACYPIGNHVFVVGAVLCAALAVLSCPIALRLHHNSRVTIIVALTALGTILLTYFVALITFSHTTDSRDSPIFGNAGELLATIAWVAITGLFCVSRVTAGLACRAASRRAVLAFSVMTAAGAALGTLCVVDHVNICQVYRSYDTPQPCSTAAAGGIS